MYVMQKFLILAGALALLAVPLDVHACEQCNSYLGLNKHTVCGWWDGALVQFPHCSPTTPWDCNGHTYCKAEEEDAEQQAAVAETVGKLLDGYEMSFDEIRSAVALTSRVRLNEERYAVQVVSCDGKMVVGHIPLDPITFRMLAQQ